MDELFENNRIVEIDETQQDTMYGSPGVGPSGSGLPEGHRDPPQDTGGN